MFHFKQENPCFSAVNHLVLIKSWFFLNSCINSCSLKPSEKFVLHCKLLLTIDYVLYRKCITAFLSVCRSLTSSIFTKQTSLLCPIWFSLATMTQIYTRKEDYFFSILLCDMEAAERKYSHQNLYPKQSNYENVNYIEQYS